MSDASDSELLGQYFRSGAEDAFAVLVQRHIDLAHSAALRASQGNPELAQEVSQSVFLQLAEDAESLQHRQSLAGWLYLTTRFKTRNALRKEQPR